MPQAVIAAAIGAGGNIAGSLLGRGSNTSTSTTAPNLTPAQQQIQALIAQMLKANLAKGVKVSQADRNAGRAHINTTFDGIGESLEAKLTARGYGDSGKLARGFKDIELQRGNAFQGLETDLRGEASQRLLQMLGLAGDFTRPQGSTTTQTGPSGPGVGSAVVGGLSNAAMSLWLQKLLGGPGGAGNLGPALSQSALDS